MRVAIFSDVHGNFTGLRAVLDDIDAQDVDEIIFAGDLCYGGPRPAECLALLRDREEIGCVYGNMDEAVAGPPALSDNIEREREELAAKAATDPVAWTEYQLSQADRAWLRTLPFQRRISPTVQPRDDLLVVHANPKDVQQVVFPPQERQKELFGKVRQTDDDLYELFSDLIAGVVAFGHLHIPSVREYSGLLLVNVSSVSMPGDGDLRAKYAILEWDDDDGWSAEHQYIQYDIESEIGAYEAARPPGWEEMVARLRQSG